jgi:outer membrane lipoprotein-sorting protein
LKALESFSHREGASRRSKACLIAFVVLFIAGCAGIERRLFERPFDPEAVAALKADLLDQREKVQSFLSAGRLQVKGWRSQELEAAIFSAWISSPLKIKIEATHPWGQPILHLLVDGETFHLLSFSERKLYTGPFTTRSLSTLLPGEVDQSLLQDLLRAYPVIDPEHRAHSNEPNRISFYGAEDKEVRVIKFNRENLRPTEVVLPHQNIRIVFSDFEVIDGLWFARETALVHALGGRRLVHNIETMVFNRTIPDQVFDLQAPPGFETVFLYP